MRPLSCTTCGAGVLVRKSSWHQTSVQWDGEAVRRCAERPAGRPGFQACGALTASIREAALSGTLPVIDDDREP
ncbi:ferredoxin [Streptomyces endophyticus]|uniref:Ferredoxin n=1 Tax=Streptomyces endophyticus TaxID=714166 RepID=A0ABU6F9R7_9ACTN|nr:ferredoxin [Streptomyces endophyticus]MEB8339601.1 ferredoxin [Streptomyces endophyticus]